MTKEAEMKNERVYKEGEKFILRFFVTEIQEYVSPDNFSIFEGGILYAYQNDFENAENITTLNSTELFRGVLPLGEIESLYDAVFEAHVEVCFDQDDEIFFLYILEIEHLDNSISTSISTSHPQYEVKIQILEADSISLVGKVLQQKEIGSNEEPMPYEAYFVLASSIREEYPPVGSIIEAEVMLDQTNYSCDEDGNYYCFNYYAIFGYKLIE